MTYLRTSSGGFRRATYSSEADLESAIVEVQHDLFGPDRYYLDIKRKIGGSNRKNIPDGYLLDLSGSKPRLFVVENELASHDPLRHIAVQILSFSLSFEDEPIRVKRILAEAIVDQPEIARACERYVPGHGYSSLDHLLEYLVFDAPFAALVIIDELDSMLENVLGEKFKFGVEVLELARYENEAGERIYRFQPFLEDVTQPAEERSERVMPVSRVDPSEVDTIVVPARDDGFEEVFLGENRWYAIRIHGSMRPQIKWIAAYRVAPTSAITHIAPVSSIEPWRDSGKYVLNFAEPAKEIGPIRYVAGARVRPPQAPRYSTKDALVHAKTLEDVW